MINLNARPSLRAHEDRGGTMSKATTETEASGRRHGGRYIYEELRKQILTLQLKPGAPLDEVSLAHTQRTIPTSSAITNVFSVKGNGFRTFTSISPSLRRLLPS